MSNTHKNNLRPLVKKLLARRERQAQSQARRRKKLKDAGWITTTMQAPKNRIAEIRKVVALLSRAKSGSYYIATVDENNKAKVVSERFTMK
ncbi:hypothetical protein [Solidesulfovibrio carbinolicus]|uniref:hypothetical protein n=1 Tax=Solidesulfovibrio carbinolicus TaxID=296842 RepID=UPI001011DF9D|nr:hypothetical protein [Solidesulfovibrio carbinolicus]